MACFAKVVFELHQLRSKIVDEGTPLNESEPRFLVREIRNTISDVRDGLARIIHEP